MEAQLDSGDGQTDRQTRAERCQGSGPCSQAFPRPTSPAEHGPGGSSLRGGPFVSSASLTPFCPWHLLLSPSHSKFKPRCPRSQRPVFRYISPMSPLRRMGSSRTKLGQAFAPRPAYSPTSLPSTLRL